MQFFSWGVLLKNYFILGYHNLDQQNDAVSLLGCLQNSKKIHGRLRPLVVKFEELFQQHK